MTHLCNCMYSDGRCCRFQRKEYDLKHPYEKSANEPETCPVCNGRGIVPDTFYNILPWSSGSTSVGTATCRSCSGRGLVWR